MSNALFFLTKSLIGYCYLSLCLHWLIISVLVSDRLTVNYVTLVVGEVLLVILTVCSLAAIFPQVRHKRYILCCFIVNVYKAFLYMMF